MVDPVALATADPQVIDPLRDLPARGPGTAVVVEGVEAVRWLLASPYPVRALVSKPGLVDHLVADVAASASRPAWFTAEPNAIGALLGFRFTRGVVAWAERVPQPALSDLVAIGAPLLVLDAIHDPVNVGTLLRSARCLGLGGAVLGPGCADPCYRRSVRASVGHVLHLPWTTVADLPAALGELRSAGWWCAAGHRGPLSIAPRALGPIAARWALVLGNEDRGPGPAVLEACARHLAIAMAPGIDSLNVAAAGAILMHELRDRVER